MNYNPNRIIKIITSYIKRHIKHYNDDKQEMLLIDLSDSKIDQIHDDTPTEHIISILGNDFREIKYKNTYNTVEFFKKNQDVQITDYRIPVKNFKYWYGIYNYKFKADTLNNLPDDMYVLPVRNMKYKYGKIIDCVYKEERLNLETLYFIDEYDNYIPYPYVCGAAKTLLIGETHQLFLKCNPCFYTEDFIKEIKKYLIDNPSILVLLDNGRYSDYQIDNIDKDKYISVDLYDYNDLIVFGEFE